MEYKTEIKTFKVATNIDRIFPFTILETVVNNEKIYGFIYFIVFDFSTETPRLYSKTTDSYVESIKFDDEAGYELACGQIENDVLKLIEIEIEDYVNNSMHEFYRKNKVNVKFELCNESNISEKAVLYGMRQGKSNLYIKELKSGINKIIQNVDFLLRSARHK